MGSCTSRDKNNGTQPFKEAAKAKRRERRNQQAEAMYQEEAGGEEERPSPHPSPKHTELSVDMNLSYSPSLLSPTGSILIKSGDSSSGSSLRGSFSGKAVVFVTAESSPNEMTSLPLTPNCNAQSTCIPGEVPSPRGFPGHQGEAEHQGHNDPLTADARPPGIDRDSSASRDVDDDSSSSLLISPYGSVDNLQLLSRGPSEAQDSVCLLPVSEHETRPWRQQVLRRNRSPKGAARPRNA